MTIRTKPKWEQFPQETLDALFEAVEINDVVDPEVRLPDSISPECTEEQMARCFALCLQFWKVGVRRSDLRPLVNKLLKEGDLSPEERQRYKHIRARCKQLRFALTLYGKHHKIPFRFSNFVGIMGHLQDAFHNRNRKATIGYALLLQAFLTRPLWAVVSPDIATFQLDSAEGFLAFRKAQFRRLKEMLQEETLSGPEFHAMRKIVSRQVSFYDASRTLQHNEHDYLMSRYLSAINGLMGSRHDEMVEMTLSGERNYRAKDAMDSDLRERLEKLVASYPL